MKAGYIATFIVVMALLGNNAAFASSQADSADSEPQQKAEYVTGGEEVEGLAKNLLDKINSDSKAEVLQRILFDTRQALTLQLNAAAATLLLDAVKFAESYLDLAISNTEANLDLTSR